MQNVCKTSVQSRLDTVYNVVPTDDSLTDSMRQVTNWYNNVMTIYLNMSSVL